MTGTLNPKTLNELRKRKRWSQEQLARESKISKSQISRWERGQKLDHIRKLSRDRLSEALGVKWETLTKPPEQDPPGTFRCAELKLTVHQSTLTALELVRRIYRVRREDIVDLAPLLFLLTAQASLQRRKRALDDAVSGVERALRDASERLPYLSHAFGWSDPEEISDEEDSIMKRRVFDIFEDADGELYSPYADYLLGLLNDLPEGLISEVPGKLIDDISAAYSGMNPPVYRVSRDLLKKALTFTIPNIDGLMESPEQFESFAGLVASGDPDLHSLSENHNRMSHEAFKAWMRPILEKAKRISEGDIDIFEMP
jgi:transcriptional regulator with XRE-family HTH domain